MHTPQRRVLHLHGRPGTRVSTDGIALRIDQRDQSPVWLPLERIAVLLIQGPVDINSHTIAQLLHAGAAVRLLAADGTALGEFDPQPESAAGSDWRMLYEQWLLKRNLMQTVIDFGTRLLAEELRRYMGPAHKLLQTVAPELASTASLRRNATRWVHRAIDLLEDPTQHPPATPTTASPEPRTAHAPPALQQWHDRYAAHSANRGPQSSARIEPARNQVIDDPRGPHE